MPATMSRSVSSACTSVPRRMSSTNWRSTFSTAMRAKRPGVGGHEADAGLGALAEPHERVGVGVHRPGLLLAQPQCAGRRRGAEDRFLGLEVPVEEALGDAGLPADVEDPRLGVATLGEQRGGGVEELLLALDGPGW